MVIDMDRLGFGVSGKGSIAYDRAYISVGGAFGDIEIGNARSARANEDWLRRVQPPTSASTGRYWPGVAGYGRRPTSGRNRARDDKIVYKSPSVGGIQLGLSYAPDGDQTSAAAHVHAGLSGTPASASTSATRPAPPRRRAVMASAAERSRCRGGRFRSATPHPQRWHRFQSTTTGGGMRTKRMARN